MAMFCPLNFEDLLAMIGVVVVGSAMAICLVAWIFGRRHQP